MSRKKQWQWSEMGSVLKLRQLHWCNLSFCMLGKGYRGLLWGLQEAQKQKQTPSKYVAQPSRKIKL